MLKNLYVNLVLMQEVYYNIEFGCLELDFVFKKIEGIQEGEEQREKKERERNCEVRKDVGFSDVEEKDGGRERRREEGRKGKREGKGIDFFYRNLRFFCFFCI